MSGRRLSPVEPPLVSDLEHESPALACASGSNHCAQRPRDPALTADHLADVILGDVKAEDECILPLLLLDADGVRIVHELSSEVLQQISQCS